MFFFVFSCFRGWRLRTGELLRELSHGTADGHARGIRRAHPEALRNFGDTPLNFHARDDQLAIFWLKMGQRLAVAIVRLRLNGALER